MAGVYRPRHPERTVLYQVLFHHFERFIAEYEERFEKAPRRFLPLRPPVPEPLLRGGGLARTHGNNDSMSVVTGSAITPGVIAAIQPFGDRINLHMYLHFQETEGGTDGAGVFYKIPRIDDSRLAEIFAREVLAFLVGRELLSPEWAERILSWPHSGFNVHSLVRAKTKPEAERVGKYMLRPVLALERLTFLEPEGKVGYRWGRDGAGQETEVMDYLEFIARVTSHIPDKGQVMVRYYGLYANAHLY